MWHGRGTAPGHGGGVTVRTDAPNWTPCPGQHWRVVAFAEDPGGVKTSDPVWLSSGGWEGPGFVVGLAAGQAVVEAAKQPVEQVALGGGVLVAGGLAAVVVGAGAGGGGPGSERPEASRPAPAPGFSP